MKKKATSSKKDKKKQRNKEEDRNSHPLNLDLDELRRLSIAMAAAQEAQQSPDVEMNGVSPSPMTETPTTPLRVPGAFQESLKSDITGLTEEKSPTPPPHRVAVQERPAEKPAEKLVDAEAAKAAGNKFFKAGDYAKAITEYTKGLLASYPKAVANLFSGRCPT